MTLVEMAGYLADLADLIDFHEDFGGTKNKWVIAEFNRVNEEFIKQLKEKHSETRQSES